MTLLYQVGDPWPHNDPTTSKTNDFTKDYNLSRLQREFSFEEPWGPDITTNGSVHRYQPAGSTVHDPFILNNEGITIQPKRLTEDSAIHANGGMEWASGVLGGYRSDILHLSNNESMTIEARLAPGQGLWSAFWGLPLIDLADWPDDYEDSILPETDVMEFVNKYGPNVLSSTTHTYNVGVPDENSTLTKTEHRHECPASIDFTTQFHKFHIMRTELQVLYGIDGIITGADPMFRELIMQGTWAMTMNVAVGGWWPGAPDDTTPSGSTGMTIKNLTKAWTPLDIDGPNRDLILSNEVMREGILACVNDRFDSRRRQLS